VSLFATEKLPQPVVITGVVDRDLPSRSLSVRPSELSSGYEKLNWRTAHQALVQAQETGWRSGGTVYASAPGAFQVAHVLPGPYLSLEVHFPSGVEAFRSWLVSLVCLRLSRWTVRLAPLLVSSSATGRWARSWSGRQRHPPGGFSRFHAGIGNRRLPRAELITRCPVTRPAPRPTFGIVQVSRFRGRTLRHGQARAGRRRLGRGQANSRAAAPTHTFRMGVMVGEAAPFPAGDSSSVVI
jgi:hypothetical protein